ncbi:MAG: phospholipase D family protein [Alphaproteobacteria bacterium]|nr:phospholipase D family protein [Alphaproteobacteria bacterium]
MTLILIRILLGVLAVSCSSVTAQQAMMPKNQRPMVCFTPEEKCYPKIVQYIDAAQHTIYMRAYAFTSLEIATALIRAHQRGVSVLVLADKGQMKGAHSLVNMLIDAGITVKREKCKGLAHNKVILIDNTILITGCYNFTKGSESRNAENLLILKQRTLLKKYLHDWKIAWEKS